MPKNNLKRTQFTFYASYFTAIENLPKIRRYEALRAVILYALEGSLPEELCPSARGVFDAIRPNLDSGRTKAAARLRELAEADPSGDSVLPTGSSKKKKKKENKNKYKNEEERKKEEENKTEAEVKAEAEMEEESAPMGAARADSAAAGLALSSRKNEDELSALARRDPKVERALEQLLRHWENEARPLSAEERKLMAWALAVHSPEEQAGALYDALFENRRQVRFNSPASAGSEHPGAPGALCGALGPGAVKVGDFNAAGSC